MSELEKSGLNIRFNVAPEVLLNESEGKSEEDTERSTKNGETKSCMTATKGQPRKSGCM